MINALAEMDYQPACEEAVRHLGGENHLAAVRALNKLAPERLEAALFYIALDRQSEATRRGQALSSIGGLAFAQRASELLPLLDQTEVVVPIPRDPAMDWRLCDQAAVVMANLLGWDFDGRLLTDPMLRAQLIQKLRDWAATTRDQ
jgi:hypothetical protein